MDFYNIQLGLNSNLNQAQLMNELKSRGSDVIQTSNGLCVKTPDSREAMSQFLKEKGIATTALSKINTDSANLTADELAFLGLK